MTVFDLEAEEKVTRGAFEVAGGGRLMLRLLTAGDIQEISAAANKTEDLYPLLEDPETKRMVYRHFRAQAFDSDLFNRMLWDRTIEGWENFLDATGKPIPVTMETKALLMTRSADMLNAYNAGMKALKDVRDADAKDQEKN